jgi:hypothetical protein
VSYIEGVSFIEEYRLLWKPRREISVVGLRSEISALKISALKISELKMSALKISALKISALKISRL